MVDFGNNDREVRSFVAWFVCPSLVTHIYDPNPKDYEFFTGKMYNLAEEWNNKCQKRERQ